METSAIYRYIWNERLWFPNSVKGELSNKTYGWKDLENVPNSSEYYPQIRDLNFGIVLGFVFVVIRYFLELYVFSPVGYWLGVPRRKPIYLEANSSLEAAYLANKNISAQQIQILSKQLDLPHRSLEIWFRKRKRRDLPTPIGKFCNNSWHLMFYTSSFIYGCIILWNKPWLWRTKESWIGWPQQHVGPGLYWLYVVELAFYCSLVITLFTDHKRKDFAEMVVHHFATITLIFFSWISNFVRIGSLILVLHDASDPWLGMAKMGVYLKKKRLTDIAFVGFVLTWSIPRMIYFPFCILNSTLFEVMEVFNGNPFAYYFFNGFLFTLFVLHIVWTWRLYKMVYITLTGGEVEDSRSDDEEEDDPTCENDVQNKKETNGIESTVTKNGTANTNGHISHRDHGATNGSTNGAANGKTQHPR